MGVVRVPDCIDCTIIKDQRKLNNHYYDRHVPVRIEYYNEADDQKVVRSIERTTQGLQCIFSCKSFFKSKNGLQSHLKHGSSKCNLPIFSAFNLTTELLHTQQQSISSTTESAVVDLTNSSKEDANLTTQQEAAVSSSFKPDSVVVDSTNEDTQQAAISSSSTQQQAAVPSLSTPKLALKDSTNYVHEKIEFRPYNLSIMNACGDENPKVIKMVEAVDLVPFGLVDENNKEVNALIKADGISDVCALNNKKIKILAKKKRPESEDENVRKKVKVEGISLGNTVLNGNYSNILKNQQYFELNQDVCSQLNTCWIRYPNLRYFCTLVFAAAILMKTDSGDAILINTFETYGRTVTVDPHCEDPDVSIPPPNSTYPGVFPMTIKSEDGTTLIIGTHIFNGLVTSSIRLDNKDDPEVGPSTKNFTLSDSNSSNNTSIYINKDSYDKAKSIAESMNPVLLFNSHSSYLMRQVRSKFYSPLTYESQRASFYLVNNPSLQPLTVFTYCNFKKRSAEADGKIGSKVFMKILSLVLNDHYNAILPKREIESLLSQCQDTTHKIPKIINDILKLYGQNDSIPILYNKNLNIELKKIANALAPYISKANKEIVENIKKKYQNVNLL